MDSSESEESEASKRWKYGEELFGELPYFIGIGSWGSVHSEEYIAEGPLTFIEAVTLSCLLQDALDELTILKYVIGAPAVPWNLNYRTTSQRFTRRLTPIRVFPEVDERPVLTSAIKLQRDRESIEVVFNKLSQNLLDDGNYDPLMSALDSLRREDSDDICLIDELKRNLAYLKELKIKVEEKRKMDEQEEKERDELMYHLQDELDDVILKCEVEEKFVNKWENVRNAQNNWRLQMSENQLKDGIAKINVKAKLERRVTHEMQLYLKLCQGELEDELEEWMARYDSEMERRENKIIHLKYNRDQAEEKKTQLGKLYEERSREMKEWIQFRELRKIRIGASLVIQSWWRGMMVRKKLGPYKPKKAKEKKEKKK